MYIVKDGGSMHIGIVALRILLSIILGYIIGFERKIRYNDAGPKTHAMVSAGACLFVIVSIYGFPDGTHDTARVAASIVTGISFLGTGNIVYNRGSIHGLTTAAGIWCTAAIGMCAGAGLIDVAIVSTCFVIVFQVLSHIPIKFLSNRNRYELKIVYSIDKGEDFILEEHIAYNKLISCKLENTEDKTIYYVSVIINNYKKTMEDIVERMKEDKHVLSMEFVDRK